MKQHGVTETLVFFQAWLRNPLRVASVTPSGRALTRLITSEIDPDTGPVIELGPGTGVFTRALIARGVAQEDLALIELGSEFAASLRSRYPKAHVLSIDAAALTSVELFEGRKAGAAVSGLPLLSMPKQKVMAILAAAFQKLTPDGAFYQFTYGPRCPVPREALDMLGLEAEKIGSTYANVPPASVFRLRKEAQGISPVRLTELASQPSAAPPPEAALNG